MRLATLLLLFVLSLLASAQEITVAGAADLNYALRDLATRFEAQSGIKIKLAFGSSGNLTAQIENGAPFDLFFSADVDYAQRLVAGGYAEAGGLYVYGVGRLVLWAPNGSPYNLGRGLAALSGSGVRKIAIANPQHAPYGRAAVAALKASGVYERVAEKLVLGENVSQAAQFVSSGNADAGIIALSLALAPSMKARGRYVEIPVSFYPPLKQAAVLLKSSKHKEAAQRFLDFIKTPAAREVLEAHGFAE
ncbi:MAG: molybdate ABC transporter substrate-binding protein [Terriglobales bacterium]